MRVVIIAALSLRALLPQGVASRSRMGPCFVAKAGRLGHRAAG